MRSAARRVSALGACVLLAGLLAGCGRGSVGIAAHGTACRLKGVETEMRCGALAVPENPDVAGGRTIDIGYAILPALARKPEPDAIFVFAGGPGQAATDVAGLIHPLFSKLNRDHDIVFVDQRGTGRSHPLKCREETGDESLAESFDVARLEERVARCAARLSASSDLTRYTTRIAMRDVDAVRAALGYVSIDAWGASYGTRAALEYARQFPGRVRTLTLDGVAPASQKLPLSLGVDAYATLVRLIDDCAHEPACAARYPTLDADLRGLFARLATRPLAVDVANPLTGIREKVVVTTEGLASLLRTPLYNSLTASLVPAALQAASRGDFDPLAALSYTVASGLEDGIAFGMHLSVVCAEDVAAMTDAEVAGARAEAVRSTVDGRPDPFAATFVDQYRRLCGRWPVATAPPASGTAGPTTIPTLLLSGGIDPATPPRHAQSLADLLPRARHLVAPHVAHGVSLQGCAPDLVEAFIRTADEESVDGRCLADIPRPPFFAGIVAGRRPESAVTVP